MLPTGSLVIGTALPSDKIWYDDTAPGFGVGPPAWAGELLARPNASDKSRFPLESKSKLKGVKSSETVLTARTATPEFENQDLAVFYSLYHSNEELWIGDESDLTGTQ
jgi:hypothetical protein